MTTLIVTDPYLPFALGDVDLRRVDFHLEIQMLIDPLSGETVLVYEPGNSLWGEYLTGDGSHVPSALAGAAYAHWDFVFREQILPHFKWLEAEESFVRRLGKLPNLQPLATRVCQACGRENVTATDPDVIYCGRRDCAYITSRDHPVTPTPPPTR